MLRSRLLPTVMALAVLGCGGAEPVAKGPVEAAREERSVEEVRTEKRRGPKRAKRPHAPAKEIDPTEVVFALRGHEADFEACRTGVEGPALIQVAW
ncbi:MAG TPA: hypothetical protein VKY73_08230, partial [Polyangiaceae bacterium]|nr:hypothetical protein [Polyangiaceae bacterium]